MYRDRECMACSHKWASEVKLGLTTRLSGEMSSQCPKCNSPAIMSSPAYSKLDVRDVTKRIKTAMNVLLTHCGVGVCAEDDGYAVTIDTAGHRIGNFKFWLHEEQRNRITRTIVGDKEVAEFKWIVTVIVICDAGYDDPPYEDTVEVAAELDPVVGVVRAVMNELERRMLEAQAPLADAMDALEEMPW